MTLARLELSGFKSFADYTEFIFDDGITSIVGPNGCGKSNVVDAVKWVLGEMSAKSLRGDAIMDDIFNGSGTRKPMGMAEVSLTFTNEDRKLPLDAESVKVTRRLYRDATSEYLINNQSSRLKDIRELFLDTGVGVDAYSLIEQGRVAALLDSNSYDRREIFEEAAGISRFKQRKKEALRKLEKTDLNLSQSQLVLEEVEKQLRSVKVQAGRARNYQEYAARLKELRSAYVMQEYDGLHRKVVALNEQLADVVDNLAAVRREMEAKRNRQAELQMELEGAQEASRKAERELLASQSDQTNLTQRGDFAREQIRQLSEQRELLIARQGEMGERLAGRQAEVKKHQEALAGVDQKLREHEAEVAEAAFRQEQAAKAIAGLNRSVDEHKSRMIDLMRQVARLHNDINGLKINQENLANQKGRLEVRKGQVDAQIAELQGKVAQLDAQRTELATRSAGLQSSAESVRVEQQANNQKMAAISQELARARENRSGLQSRQTVLNDLQNKREGVSQVVREILKSREKGDGFAYVAGMVGDLVSTDLENAGIIEAALGELQNALIVSDSVALAVDRQRWSTLAGRVSVLAADRMIAYKDGWLGEAKSRGDEAAARAVCAVDLVKCDSEACLLVHQVLGRTLIVETLQRCDGVGGRARRAEYRFVTRAGEVVEASSTGMATLVLGDISKRGGMITRRAEVARLDSANLWTLTNRLTLLTAQISQCDQASRELDRRQQELRQQIFTTDSQRAEVNAQLQQTGSQLQRTTSEAPLIAGEIESIARQSASAAARQAELDKTSTGVEEEQKKVEAVVHELGAPAHRLRQSMKSANWPRKPPVPASPWVRCRNNGAASHANWPPHARRSIRAKWNSSAWPARPGASMAASPMPRPPSPIRKPSSKTSASKSPPHKPSSMPRPSGSLPSVRNSPRSLPAWSPYRSKSKPRPARNPRTLAGQKRTLRAALKPSSSTPWKSCRSICTRRMPIIRKRRWIGMPWRRKSTN